MGTTDEQVYRADNLHLIAFLVARGCRIKDSKLRSDRLVDFFICGDEVHNLVKEYDMKSKNTFVPVHEHKAAIEHVRDIITRIKKQNGIKKRRYPS